MVFYFCFYNVYPCTKMEWINSSISLIIGMQILYILLSLLEIILRYLSFKIKSEKVYKISQILS